LNSSNCSTQAPRRLAIGEISPREAESGELAGGSSHDLHFPHTVLLLFAIDEQAFHFFALVVLVLEAVRGPLFPGVEAHLVLACQVASLALPCLLRTLSKFGGRPRATKELRKKNKMQYFRRMYFSKKNVCNYWKAELKSMFCIKKNVFDEQEIQYN
jgi:hypothetical protein